MFVIVKLSTVVLIIPFLLSFSNQQHVQCLSTDRKEKPKGLFGKFIDNIKEGFERDKDMQVGLFFVLNTTSIIYLSLSLIHPLPLIPPSSLLHLTPLFSFTSLSLMPSLPLLLYLPPLIRHSSFLGKP
jgi:hypothetical protein